MPPLRGWSATLKGSTTCLGLFPAWAVYWSRRNRSSLAEGGRRLVRPRLEPQKSAYPASSWLISGSLLRSKCSGDTRAQGLGSIRHQAEDRDELPRFGYIRHDGSSYAQHEAVDSSGFALQSDWLLRRSRESGQGGDWALRLKAVPWTRSRSTSLESTWLGTESAAPNATYAARRVRVFAYIADDCLRCSRIRLAGHDSSDRGSASLVGQSSEAGGRWSLHVSGKASPPSAIAAIHSAEYHSIAEELARNGKLLLTANGMGAKKEVTLADDRKSQTALEADTSNVWTLQLDLYPGSQADTAELVFLSERTRDSANARLDALTESNLERAILAQRSQFDRDVSETLPIVARGSYDDRQGELQLFRSARDVAVASLYGGIGFFSGFHLVNEHSDQDEAHECNVVESLFTCTPSRSKFPRGFLWDEGFHQLLLMRMDEGLSRRSLVSWLSTMRKSGWIPREQILGTEARSRVPSHFIAQEPWIANPPSLMLALEGHAVKELQGNSSAVRKEFLRWAFLRVHQWLRWLRESQAGEHAGSYYWHGREPVAPDGSEDNPKTLQSGLDDYPRAPAPSSSERHLDLRCWMAIAHRAASRIAEAASIQSRTADEMHELKARLNSVSNLRALHWDASSQLFSDYDGYAGDFVRDPVGYVTLFPLLAGMLEHNTDELRTILDVMEDPQYLWSPYGLRSLSASSEYYHRPSSSNDAPYWRGPVWLNVNYLALSELYRLSHEASRGSEASQERVTTLYRQLRLNVLRTVGRSLQRTGYMYESYDDRDGSGRGTRPFAGWTSLVALIASEKYHTEVR